MASCVYCGAEARSAEHWLPRALGTFGPLQVLRDTLCGACNNALSEVDREFIRTGPEGVQRQSLGITGRSGVGGNPFYYRAATSQPVRARVIAEAEDRELLWETNHGPAGPRGQLMRQIVVESESGVRRAIPLTLDWTADVLREAINSRGVDGWAMREVYCEPQEVEEVKSLLRLVFPRFSAQLFSPSGAGESNRTIGFINSVGAPYFRGLSKMALHGALRLTPGLKGDAWELNSLRRFVRYDERPAINPVVQLPGSLVGELDGAPRDWERGHVFIVEPRYGQLFVRLQCFVSPTLPVGQMPPPWRIRLGRVPEGVEVPYAVWFANYLGTPDASGCTGELMRLI